jgi:hypothetical protein
VDVSSLPTFRVLHQVTAVEALLYLLRRPVAVGVVEGEDPGPVPGLPFLSKLDDDLACGA